MISRIWKGWTTAENAAAYEEILRTSVLPGIKKTLTTGYHGVHVLKREHDGGVEFMTILWLDSEDVLAPLLGDDLMASHVPAEARAVLGRFEERVAHYEVVRGEGIGH